MTCSRIETDGMRYIDGEMTPHDRAEYERHLERCDDCRRSLEDFGGLQSLTRRIKMKDPTDEFWEVYWKSLYRRLERRIAWIIMLIGAIMLIVYQLYQAASNFGRITFEKVALVLFAAGAAMLLISVVRERVHHYKVDRYKDIER
jgi:predicted anti-sigma-YlaC factor YlaD